MAILWVCHDEARIEHPKMRTRLRNFGVFSLSAIDLFASAMGAFIIISLILMPDYQKEVRLEGSLQLH